ncbi:hypothetical protein [uncultured Thermosynechococcus sp.]|uniref:hypothetical protein n=1 Tax=uncultured Thermosynechococcus sp. TaxID=436945 RepID=UPI00262E5581|nr:hypothetical protein [uncultured Thermosynechococcus sp.]
MEIFSQVQLPFPREHVYRTYRDRLPELVNRMPNVRAIEVQARKESPQALEMVLVWHGGGEIPAAARALLSEAMLSWTDYTHWSDRHYLTRWRIAPHAFTEAIDCQGENQFIAVGDSTIIISRGHLRIDPKRMSGVHSFLAGKIARAVEEYLGQRIEPNFQQLAASVAAFLRPEGGQQE